MFDKPDKTTTDNRLADRLRQIADKPALEGGQYHGDVPSLDRAPRQSTFKPAALTLEGGGRMNVVVKNVSSSGMRIEFVPKITLPDEVIVAEPTLRIRTWAMVVWQGGGAAGLKFVAG